MMVWIVGLVILAGAIALAMADVFWPLVVASVFAVGAFWWYDALALLWRPDLAALYVTGGLIWIAFKWTRVVEHKLRDAAHAQRHHPTMAIDVPKWREHSGDFTAYFFFWPFDATAYLLSDLLLDTWRFVSNMVGRSFDRYAAWRFAKLTEKL